MLPPADPVLVRTREDHVGALRVCQKAVRARELVRRVWEEAFPVLAARAPSAA